MRPGSVAWAVAHFGDDWRAGLVTEALAAGRPIPAPVVCRWIDSIARDAQVMRDAARFGVRLVYAFEPDNPGAVFSEKTTP